MPVRGVTVCDGVLQVAVKIIDTRKMKDEYQRSNLHREARVMAILRHPNIVRLYETLKVQYAYSVVLSCLKCQQIMILLW